MSDNDRDILDDEPAPSPSPRKEQAANSGAAPVSSASASPRQGGASRRSFLIGSAIGAGAGVVAGAGIVGVSTGAVGSGGVNVSTRPGAAGGKAGEPMDSKVVSFSVNGQKHELLVRANQSVAEVLRQELDLTGTKIGCNRSECSACTVLMNNVAVNACSELAIRLDGASLITIEGLEKDGKLHPVQAAYAKYMGLQCGFCTPGQILQTVALLQRVKNPTDDQITHQMAGNLCKCSTYPNILASIKEAAKTV